MAIENIILPIVYSVALLFCIVLNGILIINFQHPDDKNQAFFPKMVVLAGLLLSEGIVLALSLDVANGEGNPVCSSGYNNPSLCGGIDMVLLWETLYVVALFFVVVLIPFTIFYYEADDGEVIVARNSDGAKGDAAAARNNRCLEASKYTTGVVLISGLLFYLCSRYINEVQLPLTTIEIDSSNFQIFLMTGGQLPNGLKKITDEEVSISEKATLQEGAMILKLTPVLFVMAIFSFVGWILFAFFTGIGLASFPIDNVTAYLYRPRHMDAVEFAGAQLSIRERTDDLVDIGEMLRLEREDRRLDQKKRGYFKKRRYNNLDQKTLNRFKQAVYVLEKDVADLKLSHEKYSEYNPLIPFLRLLLGCVTALLSLLWIIQICVYVLFSPPLHPFLNSYLTWFDSWFPLFGVITIMVLALYLLACTVNGNFKLGLRFFWFTIHPMEWNKTYVSSFLFNVMLILLCSIPVVQFCSVAFADYARRSNIQQIFGTQVSSFDFSFF